MLNLNTKWSDEVLPWLLDHGVKIVLVLILSFVLRAIIHKFLGGAVRKMIQSNRFSSKEAETKREDTLIKILNGTMSIIIWLITILVVMEELGFAIGPFLAAAGIVGLALGFGGQYLIKDLISGLFIILENQYRVGDTVCFGSTCGMVEDISLRMTSIRDLDGTIHHIPHGEIKQVSNQTKGYSRINMDIGIGYSSDIEHVEKVINKIGKEMKEDVRWTKFIIKAPYFLRIEDFADSAIIVKIFGETIPTKQWEIAGDLRKRIKIAFDKEGIDLPFPQRVIHSASVVPPAKKKVTKKKTKNPAKTTEN